jgi:uncharacterized protein YndB with AHSA1/START domain
MDETARDGTLHDIDGHPVLRFERRLRHPVTKVWRALTDPAELSTWFPWQVQMDARVGGTMSFTHPEGVATAADAVITELEPPHVFAFCWNGEDLRWELTEDGEHSVLVFTHEFLERPAAAKFAAGWHVTMHALVALLDGMPALKPDFAAVNAAYVQAFGLLDGAVVDTAEGQELRFEQELLQPAAVVWDALAGAVQLGERPPATCAVADVPAGPVTELRIGEALAYPWSADGTESGTVAISLVPQDFGTRLVLTQSVPGAVADRLTSARTAWRDKLADFAAELSSAS